MTSVFSAIQNKAPTPSTAAPLLGTVAHTLTAMRGVWHDHVEVYDLAGRPLTEDLLAGSPGSAPFDNLVYIDFDGERWIQTNVTFRGRPLSAKTFSGRLVDGVLQFDSLGPEAPRHMGTGAGPGTLFLNAYQVTDSWTRYLEPDVVTLLSPNERTRVTLLYRDGKAVRTLRAHGTRLAPSAHKRLDWDPRGADGEVHERPMVTNAYQGQQ
ncbi:MAG: hypothetical protein CMP23_05675 [Rickettsiales bacterium]|nr:hypothetical protein [Rickettsiales bacterium]